MRTLTLRTPDDCHLHLRDGAMLKRVVQHTAREFTRAVVMPNLTPPVTTVAMAREYRLRILDAVDAEYNFEPLMTLYLTDNTRAEDIVEASEQDWLVGAKLYPAGATTNSDCGVTSIVGLMPILETMAESGLVLQVHGEVTDPHIDIFDREAAFIEQVLQPITHELPELRIVLEHITTRDAVAFVREAGANVAATITAHHLLFNRNDMLVGGIKPHYYCLPVLKRNIHQVELMEAATSGNPKFFLGTDSAPHSRAAKESACGCAGVYTGHAALEFYAEMFERLDALERLQDFASHFGPDFYRLPRNTDSVILRKVDWQVAQQLPLGEDSLTPLRAGETVRWQVTEQSA